jgi:hypothetical protein
VIRELPFRAATGTSTLSKKAVGPHQMRLWARTPVEPVLVGSHSVIECRPISEARGVSVNRNAAAKAPMTLLG